MNSFGHFSEYQRNEASKRRFERIDAALKSVGIAAVSLIVVSLVVITVLGWWK